MDEERLCRKTDASQNSQYNYNINNKLLMKTMCDQWIFIKNLQKPNTDSYHQVS